MLRRLHHDQRGTMSVVSVFAMILLAMLLGMVMNTARQVDGKIKMQNAADAATYSGGLVLARGMNTLAFSNHLLCDVFALTAFMREARDRNAESVTPPVLDAWQRVGDTFSTSGFPKFDRLGRAIQQKVPAERQMVHGYSDWAAAASDLVLPVLEEILEEEQIPEFQRALVMATPELAQQATAEVARRHGLTSPDRGTMQGVLWRTVVDPVGGISESSRSTLPVVDPVLDELPNQPQYQSLARQQRASLARQYLAEWNRASLHVFDREARMSQFGVTWRGFTCAQLKKLLAEYPDTNLPHMIRDTRGGITDTNQHLEDDFTFVGVTSWPQVVDMLPGLFKNPMQSDPQTFAQTMMFVPQPRLIKVYDGIPPDPVLDLGGVPGDIIRITMPGDDQQQDAPDPSCGWHVVRQGRPMHWDLLNQNWTAQLVPATSDAVTSILETNALVAAPSDPGGGECEYPSFTRPNFGRLRSNGTRGMCTR